MRNSEPNLELEKYDCVVIYFILLRSVLYLLHKLMFAGLRLAALKTRCLFLLRVILSAEIQGCLFLPFCSVSLHENINMLLLMYCSIIRPNG